MSVVSWKIYWNEYTSETYLYGSQIIFHKKDRVEFINEMMPPGKVIKTWYSKVFYQMKRVEPSLPMIDGESKYHIHLDVDCDKENGILLRIVFVDRYENDVESIIMRERDMDFRCPLKTYSYRIELINTGANRLQFHSFTLTEYSNES